MFSGIVTNLQKALKISRKDSEMELTFKSPGDWDVGEGESINIDGVCSTIQKITAGDFTVYYMPETLRKTSLRQVQDTHQFNLERSLTLNSLIGGHLVSGHIDTTATVYKVTSEGISKVIEFKIDPQFTNYIIYKGSITVNGVSLTIVEVTNTNFSVSLIPHTLKYTNLGELKIGDQVNIEVDLIAKYLQKLIII